MRVPSFVLSSFFMMGGHEIFYSSSRIDATTNVQNMRMVYANGMNFSCFCVGPFLVSRFGMLSSTI